MPHRRICEMTAPGEHADQKTGPLVRRGMMAHVGAALTLAGACILVAPVAVAQDTIVAKGIATFDEMKYGDDFDHLGYVNPNAPKGGEMSLWAFGGFDSMNPYSIKGRSGIFASVSYESILEGTSDEVGASYCLLCETLEYPPDRGWVIFNLRHDVRFSDGSPLTGEDVIFSFNEFLTKGLNDFRVVLAQQVESAELLDPMRVKFTFRDGFPTRDLPQVVGGLPILSKADYETNGRSLEDSSLDPFLGTGPYVLDSMRVGQTLIYARNPDYWGRDHPLNRGRWNFDRIRFEYYADYDAAFEGFKAGSYFFRTEARALLWATGYDFPSLARGHVLRKELPDGNMATSQSFVFNLRREKFQDPRVREAIAMMFNFEWSNEALFNGLYARINSFWENSELAATGLPTPQELAILEPMADILPAGVLTEEAVMGAVSSTRQPMDRGNRRLASDLLDQAGWEVGADGMRRNGAGETLRVEFLNSNSGFDRIINPYVENLRAIGIDALMTRVDDAQMTNRERNHDFDMITDQMPMSYIPGSGLKQYFGSQTADVSTFNKMGLKSEAVDRLVDIVLSASTKDDLTHSTRALDRVLRAYRFWVPQWFKNTHWVAYYDMYEAPDPLPPFTLGQVDLWWFNAEKAAALHAAGAIR